MTLSTCPGGIQPGDPALPEANNAQEHVRTFDCVGDCRVLRPCLGTGANARGSAAALGAGDSDAARSRVAGTGV